MKEINRIKEQTKEELLSQNFNNLVGETLNIVKSSNPLEALQLASLENTALYVLYEEFEKVLDSTVELPLETKLEILRLLKDGGEVGQETYDLFASAWSEIGVPDEESFPIKEQLESVIEIRNRIYEKAKDWVKENVVEIPLTELEAVRMEMLKIKETGEDVFNQLRGQLGSAVLYRAEGKSKLDISKALRLIEILFGKKQSDLTRNIYLAYRVLLEKTNFQIKFREEDKPSFNPGTINLIRNKLDTWYGENQDQLSEEERNRAETVLFALDNFLIGISRKANPSRAEALIYQRKMRKGVKMVAEIDETVRQHLLPKNIADLLQFIEGEIGEVKARLITELSKAGTIDFSESKPYLNSLQFLAHRLNSLRGEIAGWNGLEKEMLEKELTPRSTNTDRLVKYLELEIKHLQEEVTNLQSALDEQNLSQKEVTKIVAVMEAIDWRMKEMMKIRDFLTPSKFPVSVSFQKAEVGGLDDLH